MNFLKRASLKTQFFVLLIIYIVSIPLLVTIYYHNTSDYLIAQKSNDNIDATKILQNNIQAQYNDIAMIMLHAGYSDASIAFLTTDTTYQTYKNVYSMFNMLTAIDKNIFNISLTPSDKTAYSVPGFRSSLPPSCLSYDDGQVHYDGYAEIKTTSSLSVPVFSYSMNIFSYGNTKASGKRIGYMTLLVKVSSIVEEISSFSTLSDTSFYMVDSFGKTICLADHLNLGDEHPMIADVKSSLPSYIYSESSDGSRPVSYYIEKTGSNDVKYMIQVNPIETNLGYTMAITPYSALLANAIVLRNMCYSIAFILFLFTAIIYLIMMKNIISPLNDLAEYITSINHGNLRYMKKRVVLKGTREIEEISNKFNLMMDEINQMREQLFLTTSSLYEREIADKKSKNLTLINQINPHFLFNTLDVIKGSVLMTGNKELFNVCHALGAIMKYSLCEEQTSTLRQEISAISDLMKIIDYRFGDRIWLDVDYPDELADYPLPRLFLYQYIYKTINGRLEPMAESGLIVLKAGKDRNAIFISIADNGLPITEENGCAELNRNMETRLYGFYPKGASLRFHIDDSDSSNRMELTFFS